MEEAQKEAMRLGREQAKLNKEKSDVSIEQALRNDLENFKKSQEEQNDKILGVLETLVNKDKVIGQTLENEVLEEVKVPEEKKLQSLEGKQLVLFEKYFDPLDGFKAWYNVNQNIFTIEVPMKLSNMIEAQRVLYKQDLRSKKVDQNNILGSIDSWCRLVCQNLKYNRKLRLK